MASPDLTEKHSAELFDKNAPQIHHLASANEPIEAYRTTWVTWLAVFALSLANGCATLSNTANTTIRYQVQSTGGIIYAPWIANAGFLVTLAFGPIFGSLADRVGKKLFVVGGCAFGVIGTAVSGSASQTLVIVGGQALTGVANAGCLVSIAANQEIMPNRLRPYAMAMATTINGLLALVGTFGFAGYVSNNTGGGGGWPYAYYTLTAVYGAVGLLVFLTYRPPPPQLAREYGVASLLKHVDLGGIFLFAGSVAALIIGLTWGGNAYAWSDAQVVAPLTIGCVGFLALGLYERFVKRDGLFDNRLFQSATYPVLLFVCAIDGLLLLGANVFFSQEIQAIYTSDAIGAAIYLIPYLLTSTFLCIPAGYVLARTRSLKWPLVAALCWTALFAGLLGLLTPDRKAMSYVFSGLMGAGLAFTTVLPVVGVTLVVPQNLIGSAATISLAMRALGGIIGVTLFTVIQNAKLGDYLPAQIAAVVAANDLPPALTPVLAELIQIPDPTVLPMAMPNLTPSIIGQLHAALSIAEASAYTYVWAAVAAFVGANAIAALFIGDVSSKFTSHVESALEDSETRRKQLAGEI